MLDKDLFAECIGIVKHTPAVTVQRVSNELMISETKAAQILDELEDCNLIARFKGFYASLDLWEFN